LFLTTRALMTLTINQKMYCNSNRCICDTHCCSIANVMTTSSKIRVLFHPMPFDEFVGMVKLKRLTTFPARHESSNAQLQIFAGASIQHSSQQLSASWFDQQQHNFFFVQPIFQAALLAGKCCNSIGVSLYTAPWTVPHSPSITFACVPFSGFNL